MVPDVTGEVCHEPLLADAIERPRHWWQWARSGGSLDVGSARVLVTAVVSVMPEMPEGTTFPAESSGIVCGGVRSSQKRNVFSKREEHHRLLVDRCGLHIFQSLRDRKSVV